MSDSQSPLNSDIFKRHIANFAGLEEQGVFTRLHPLTGEPEVLGVKPVTSRTGVTFEEVRSFQLPPFGELSKRLNAYAQRDRILHGGARSSVAGRKQTHCLDWLPSSEFSVDRLLWDCAIAIRFDQEYAKTKQELAYIRDNLQQRAPLYKNVKASIARARDMQRLAAALNPGLATGATMLRPLDGLEQSVLATQTARGQAEAQTFGCIHFPHNIQKRQIENIENNKKLLIGEKTPACWHSACDGFSSIGRSQPRPSVPNGGHQRLDCPPPVTTSLPIS